MITRRFGAEDFYEPCDAQRPYDGQECKMSLLRQAFWLRTYTYRNPIIKWETAQWGEIPADFGRK